MISFVKFIFQRRHRRLVQSYFIHDRWILILQMRPIHLIGHQTLFDDCLLHSRSRSWSLWSLFLFVNTWPGFIPVNWQVFRSLILEWPCMHMLRLEAKAWNSQISLSYLLIGLLTRDNACLVRLVKGYIDSYWGANVSFSFRPPDELPWLRRNERATSISLKLAQLIERDIVKSSVDLFLDSVIRSWRLYEVWNLILKALLG